jgi:hypothetical protein
LKLKTWPAGKHRCHARGVPAYILVSAEEERPDRKAANHFGVGTDNRDATAENLPQYWAAFRDHRCEPEAGGMG